jgi:hypothetical protein
MSAVEPIRGFLAAVRRRLILRTGLEAAGYGVALLGTGLALLALAAVATGPAAFWPVVTASAFGGAALAVLVWGVWRPARSLRRDRAAARHAGTLLPAQLPTLASDLLSAVELAEPPPADPRAASVSTRLVQAFQEYVARSLTSVDAQRLVSLRPVIRAAAAALIVVAALGTGAWLSSTFARGLRTLIHRPSLFEGAAVSTMPLVGDVRIIYSYPAYTGLPPRTVEGSTGDVAAVKGTRVRIITHPLRSARRVLLLLGESGEKGEVAANPAGDLLAAELTVSEDTSYRFWLQPTFGRAVREARSHHVTAETDSAPRVEILGPADRLELATPRPIEIGYSASDDFGLSVVELVTRAGDRPEQRTLLRDGGGARAVQGRTLWDPASAGLSGAERIAYRIEARDKDDISGGPTGKVGSSRTLYVVIQNPHESLEDRLERQRELLEKLIGDLADRIEKGGPPGPPGGEGAAAPAPTFPERLAAYAAMHDAEDAHLALLGQLIDEDRRNGTMGKVMRAALTSMADRLERLLRDEKQALAAFKGKTATGNLGRLEALSARQVTELENDVLLLDDLIGRQRLEDLASLGKELTDSHQRLKDLLERYKKTKDEALRRQLEREARELRARIADLAAKIAAVKARNDVPDEWRNLPDMKSLADQARKLDDLLEKGNEADLERALAQLGNDLGDLRKMLDENAGNFGSERFPQENRVVADLMKKIGDIEGDQRALQKETQAIADKQEAEIQRRLKGQMDEFIKKEIEKVERLKQRLGGVQSGNPQGSLAEELERARESTRQLRRLLGERDLPEAKGEAERAEGSLERATEQLDAMAEARKARRPGTEPEKDKRAEAVAEARALAQEIADDLAKLLPKPSDMLTPQEREAGRAQAERQGAIGKRTEDVAGEAMRRLGKMPGMEKAEGELKGAAARMRQAQDMLRRDESKGAAAAERDAADRLAKLRDSMQERPMGGSRQPHEPVRIPGADESSAPRAWRQELLDAMKEKAPERFKDEVRRYYEELVR